VDRKNETDKAVTISYASSSALARQVDQSAPADIFFAADLDWMDWLQQRNLIKASRDLQKAVCCILDNIARQATAGLSRRRRGKMILLIYWDYFV
jgi:hypothetical protein